MLNSLLTLLLVTIALPSSLFGEIADRDAPATKRADLYSIRGVVELPDDAPPDLVVRLMGLKVVRSTFCALGRLEEFDRKVLDEDGAFVFDQLEVGRYQLRIGDPETGYWKGIAVAVREDVELKQIELREAAPGEVKR